MIVTASFILLIRHIRKAARGDTGCQGCVNQNNCKK